MENNSTEQLKIAILEDSVEDTALLFKGLKNANFQGEILAFSKYTELKQYMEKDNNIDLFILDVYLIEIDGLEVTKQIRLNAKYDSIPIIILTGSLLSIDAKNCYKAGASLYLIKPTNFDKLCDMMSCIVNLFCTLGHQNTWRLKYE